ncbi:hypothetical protein AU184_26055 [Mycolicibacterium novocastrense]|nr:hypothetical protein AU072_18240 [Mycolicibacterium novocastrense]KUH71164.1 hypothetical protein AU183_20165 [Mycolicibacterium novocastrense]KUH73319.1 hypothetical protein AU184_26055 [Mycolicibacterium novocastrense]
MHPVQTWARVKGRACSPQFICDITTGIKVSQPTVSHQSELLRDAGLLTFECRVSWVYYTVVPELLQPLSALRPEIPIARTTRVTGGP